MARKLNYLVKLKNAYVGRFLNYLLNLVLLFLLCLEYFQSHQSHNSTGGIDTIFVGSPAIGL